ncbi:hypothetical protein RND71_004251 [Anisodus tanguticus]|uniref:Uncharacterized protein n=1 Tax=Anisodus tanguticus TaxID=243964 RepID=A0AAE1SXA2_9SOLA|nr:hypothetical protein RND71_004251 [Anisodus tanguticus]
MISSHIQVEEIFLVANCPIYLKCIYFWVLFLLLLFAELQKLEEYEYREFLSNKQLALH